MRSKQRKLTPARFEHATFRSEESMQSIKASSSPVPSLPRICLTTARCCSLDGDLLLANNGLNCMDSLAQR